MAQSRPGRRSFGPYGCLLFLIGLGFLVAGIGSGMVPDAINNIRSQSPESNGAYRALGTWGLVTLGALGLGSFGVRYYGFRGSILGFGFIMVICGLLGLYVHNTSGETSNSGNAIWAAVNFVGDLVGSLHTASLIALVGGGILVLGILMTGKRQRQKTRSQSDGFTGDLPSRFTQSLKKDQVLTCPRCGHPNASWFVVCEQCGKRF